MQAQREKRDSMCREAYSEGIVALTNWLLGHFLRVRSFRRVRRFGWPGLTLTTSIRVESSTWRSGRGGLSAGTVLTGHWTHSTHGAPEPDLSQPSDDRSPSGTPTMQALLVDACCEKGFAFIVGTFDGNVKEASMS